MCCQKIKVYTLLKHSGHSRLWPVSLYPQVADNGAASTKFFHCFLSLTCSAACRIPLLLCCKSYLTLSIYLLVCRPRLLVPDINVFSDFAGNLELFIRFTFTWPNQCSLSLYLLYQCIRPFGLIQVWCHHFFFFLSLLLMPANLLSHPVSAVSIFSVHKLFWMSNIMLHAEILIQRKLHKV